VRGRYGELRRAVGGVTDKVLIQQLKELHAEESLDRLDYKAIPPKVEYSLHRIWRLVGDSIGAALRLGNRAYG